LKRTCFKCKEQLVWEDFVGAWFVDKFNMSLDQDTFNDLTMDVFNEYFRNELLYLKSLWASPYIQLYCCKCYDTIKGW